MQNMKYQNEVFGFYYNGEFYSDETHDTLITPSEKTIYIDIDGIDDGVYIYKNGKYEFIESTTIINICSPNTRWSGIFLYSFGIIYMILILIIACFK